MNGPERFTYSWTNLPSRKTHTNKRKTADDPTTKYGEKLREQVEERLRFYDTGAAPRKNVDVMAAVRAELEGGKVGEGGDGGRAAVEGEKKKKKVRQLGL